MKRIIAWVILILLLLLPAPFAQDDGTMLEWPHTTTLLWSVIDTIYIPPRDTTRYYIKEIKQKCDTANGVMLSCSVYNCDCSPFPFVTNCRPDTIWADKVQVWLTPEQLEGLIKQITPRKPGEPMEWIGTY